MNQLLIFALVVILLEAGAIFALFAELIKQNRLIASGDWSNFARHEARMAYLSHSAKKTNLHHVTASFDSEENARVESERKAEQRPREVPLVNRSR